MCNLIEYAKQELLFAGYKPIEEEEDGPNKWIQENLLELLDTFSKQGHSGFSASYCLSAFKTLASFKPLTPLTGSWEEWGDVCEDAFQNKRDSSVFKDRKTGVCYTIDGYVFDDLRGCGGFTSKYSRKLVTFPYIPKSPEVVEVFSIEVDEVSGEIFPGSGWWETEYPQWILWKADELRKLLEEK